MNVFGEWTGPLRLTADQIGRVLKTARIASGLDQDTVGARCGFSGSTVCRWEQGKRHWTLDDLAKVSTVLGVPGHLVGLAEPPPAASPGSLVRSGRVRHDEPMKRRTLIAAGLSTVAGAAAMAPRSNTHGVERALFDTAEAEPVALRALARRTTTAEGDLVSARLNELDRSLPALIETAYATRAVHNGADAQRAASLLSRVLAVTAQHQIRLSRETIASVAADRAADHAAQAGDPVAGAEAARVQATVLRRSGSPIADRVMVSAAERLRSETGLSIPAAAGMYAKVIAAAAYTAAGHDDRGATAEYLTAARTAIEPFNTTPHMAKSELDVFTVSCHRVLGDHGAALHHARAIDLTTVPGTHQKGRFWQEVAIAAYGRGRVDLAIDALAELDRVAPQYLRPRPWLRDLVCGLLSTRQGGTAPLLDRLATQLHLT